MGETKEEREEEGGRERGRDTEGEGFTERENAPADGNMYLCIQLLPLILPVAVHTLAVEPKQNSYRRKERRQ